MDCSRQATSVRVQAAGVRRGRPVFRYPPQMHHHQHHTETSHRHHWHLPRAPMTGPGRTCSSPTASAVPCRRAAADAAAGSPQRPASGNGQTLTAGGPRRPWFGPTSCLSWPFRSHRLWGPPAITSPAPSVNLGQVSSGGATITWTLRDVVLEDVTNPGAITAVPLYDTSRWQPPTDTGTWPAGTSNAPNWSCCAARCWRGRRTSPVTEATSSR